VDWEWSTTVPLQLFAMPPTGALRPVSNPTVAQLQGKEMEVFIGHVREYMDCLRLAEEAIDPDCPIWRLAQENWETGRYWLHTALMSSWDVDYPFWNQMFPRWWPGRNEGEFIREFKSDPSHVEMLRLIKQKCSDLERYEEDLARTLGKLTKIHNELTQRQGSKLIV